MEKALEGWFRCILKCLPISWAYRVRFMEDTYLRNVGSNERPNIKQLKRRDSAISPSMNWNTAQSIRLRLHFHELQPDCPVSRIREGSRAGMLPFPAALSWLDANKSYLPGDPNLCPNREGLLNPSNFLLTIFYFPIVRKHDSSVKLINIAKPG